MTVDRHDQALKGEGTRGDGHCVQYNRGLKGETDPALLEKKRGVLTQKCLAEGGEMDSTPWLSRVQATC